MKLILSRKGFDSTAGGIPSPIFPDGSIRALPIPDNSSPIRFADIPHQGDSLAGLLTDLGAKNTVIDAPVHLDPDVVHADLSRPADWQPLFGQSGAAQGHLKKQNVGKGDLLLFFGLFQPVEHHQGQWRFRKDQPPVHMIWGWMQIADVASIDDLNADELAWARYHPHFFLESASNNTLYMAAPKLTVDGLDTPLPGAGHFARYSADFQLTAPDAPSVTHWQLPVGFYPSENAPALTYHQKPERWQRGKGYCRLRCASRGQEFVLDLTHYPALNPWLTGLFNNHGGTRL